MPAHRTQYGLRHLTHLQLVCGILKLLQRLIRTDPVELSAISGRTGILRHLLGQFGEVGTLLQSVVDRVDAHLGSLLLILGCFLLQQDEDVGRHDQSARTDGVLRVLIHEPGLFFHIVIGNERRCDLLVTIGAEFLLVGSRRIQLCIQSGLHLQFVIDKEIDVLVHGLLVNHTLRIILVVRILKLRARNRLSCHSHDNRVVCLRKSHAPGQEHGQYCQMLFHLIIIHWVSNSSVPHS